MANPEHLAILKQDVEAWNEWRTSDSSPYRPDLAEAELTDLLRIVLEFDGTNIARVTVTDEALFDELFLFDLAQDRFV